MRRWLTLFLVFLAVNIATAQTEVEGEVSGVWDAEGSPYIVVDSTWVPEEEELTIEAGVEVLFAEGLGIDVFGSINAEGTEEDSIFFLPIEEDQSWRGIYLHGRDVLNEFSYCVNRGAYRGFGLNRFIRINIEHCDISSSDNAIGRAVRRDPEGQIITIDHSRLVCEGARIKFSMSRLMAYDSEFLMENGPYFSLGSIRLERCRIRGSASAGHTVYIDCEFLPKEEGVLYVDIIGDFSLMENCIVPGDVNAGPGHNMLITDSVIEGEFFGCGIENASIIRTEIISEYIRLMGGQLNIFGCSLQGRLSFRGFYDNSYITLDSCFVLGNITANASDRYSSMMTINRCIIIGWIPYINQCRILLTNVVV